MFHLIGRRVGFVLMVLVILGALAIPAASAGTEASPTQTQQSTISAGHGQCSQYYIIRRGDNLSRIAYRYGTTVNALMRCNNIWDPDVIYWGQKLCICGAYNPPPPPPPPPPRPKPQPKPRPLPCQQTCQQTCQQNCQPGWTPCEQSCQQTCQQSCQPWPGQQPQPQPWQQPQPPYQQPAPCGWQRPCCTDSHAVITSPGQNARVAGWVTVMGTATHEDFAFYKLEYGAGSSPTDWSWFAGGEQPIVNGPLGVFNTGGLPCGTYTIRLVVVDDTGNYPTPCQVTVTIVR
jgi:LysM repeat protein